MFSINNQYNNENKNPIFSKERTIKHSIKGNLHKILSLPDKYPKLRIILDITIIALSVIVMVSMILTSGLGSPIFFAIVPLIGFAGLGGALLISDTVKNKKVKKIAEKISAITIPLIILGSGIAFITAGYLSIPTSAAFLGTPQFILGITISGLALVALKNITIPKLTKTNNTSYKKNKQISTNVLKNKTAIKTENIINQKKEKQINEEIKKSQRKNIREKKINHKLSSPKHISYKKEKT